MTYLPIVAIAVSSGLVGALVFLQQRTLSADAVAHSLLPGVGLGYLLQSLGLSGFALILGTVTGGMAVSLIDLVARKSKLDYNSATAIFLSLFYGLGIMLLTAMQNQGIPGLSNLNRLMFGNAAAIQQSEANLAYVLVVATSLIIYFYRKPLVLFLLDPTQAKTAQLRGIPFLINVVLIANVALTTYVTGMILAGAFLVAPAAAAFFWSKRFGMYVMFACIFATISAVGGTFISASFVKSPSGPWATLLLFGFVVSSGLIAKWRGRRIKHI